MHIERHIYRCHQRWTALILHLPHLSCSAQSAQMSLTMSQQSFQSVEYVGSGTSPTDLDSDHNRQSSGSTPHLSAKYATQLSRFHLRLIDQPQLLVCTLPDCTAGLPLVPSFAKITAHLKEFHSHAVPDRSARLVKIWDAPWLKII